MAATQRQQQAIDTHHLSMVVTAGAGTGKTFVLVEKYLSLIENQGLSPRDILALTFTDKAAAEMKERVRDTIGKRIAANPTDPLWKSVEQEVIIAPILTFHSFCAQILREFAIEAGLDAGFLIIDEGQSLSIRKDAFDLLLKKPLSPTCEEALIRVLAQVEKFRLSEILTTISEKYDLFDDFFALVRGDTDTLMVIWKEFLDSVREPEVARFFSDENNTTAIADLIRFAHKYTDPNDSAARYLASVREYLKKLNPDVPAEELSAATTGFLSVRPKGKIGTQKVWERDELERFRSAKSFLIKSLEKSAPYFSLSIDIDSAFTNATCAFYSDLAIIAEDHQTIITNLKKQASGMDFGDLITLAKRFLEENQDLVARHLRPRIKYVLIDEFQDTDPAQFDIIQAIIGDLCQDTNCLFIVGDPKQSIYLFRDADVTRFKEAQQRILSDCNGTLINLDTSFRSSREVIGAVNHLFAGIFASAEKPWEFGYEPIFPCDDRRNSQGSVQILLPEKAEEGSSQAESKEIEAGMVAELIHRIVESRTLQVTSRDGSVRPAGYGDFAILIERRTHLSRYMDALSRMETPYYVHGGIGFYSRQEIYDIYNILSFLLRPYDDAALYGTLRSPYFSLSDTTLFRIIQHENRRGFTLLEKLKQYMIATTKPDEDTSNGNDEHTGQEEEKAVARAYTLLSSWTAHAGREQLVLLLTRILRESGILTVYGAQELGTQQIANLEKLIQIARVRAESPGYGLSQLVHDMTASIGNEEREGEAALDTLSETSVNIMTVHAAKGLEFPIVILVDMGSSRESTQPSVLIGDSFEIVGMKLPNPQKEYEMDETPVYTAISLIQKEKEAAERKRLFYVGATRARDHLIFCGRKPSKFYATIEESSNRIDWVCTMFNITAEVIEEIKEILIDPSDGQLPIPVPILTDPDQLTRVWAYDQPSALIPPKELLFRQGEYHGRDLTESPGKSTESINRISVSQILSGHSSQKDPAAPFFEIPAYLNLTREEAGTILHQIFAGKDAQTVLLSYGISSAEAVSWCNGHYQKFMISPVMQKVKEHYCEVSFVLPVQGHIIEGRIDRLCRLSDNTWIVIEYKSGAGQNAELQLAVYVLAAEKLLKKPVYGYVYHISTEEMEKPDRVLEDTIYRVIEEGCNT